MVPSRMHPRAGGIPLLWLGMAGLAALLAGCSDSSGPAHDDAYQGGVQIGGAQYPVLDKENLQAAVALAQDPVYREPETYPVLEEIKAARAARQVPGRAAR